jgi:hypothetical protein
VREIFVIVVKIEYKKYNKIMRLAFTFIFILSVFSSQCQSNSKVFILVKAMLNGQELASNMEQKINLESNIIKINELKFYLSNIQFFNNQELVWSESNSYHLCDIFSQDSKLLEFNFQKEMNFNKIVFCLGIDSITNVSGAYGGDLDPTKGMYWTWQNGYINLKLEGEINDELTTKNKFSYHLGGYLQPFNAIQKIELNVNNKKSFNLDFNLDKIFKSQIFYSTNKIMSPNYMAVELSKIAASCFRIE